MHWVAVALPFFFVALSHLKFYTLHKHARPPFVNSTGVPPLYSRAPPLLLLLGLRRRTLFSHRRYILIKKLAR